MSGKPRAKPKHERVKPNPRRCRCPDMNSASSTPAIDDNPCWGGPEPNLHDLEQLLHVLGSDDGNGRTRSDINPSTAQNDDAFSSTDAHSEWIRRIHEKLIIYQDENYIAIHKPADLRMDGPHRATVHKLLLYLFPPPSLQKMVDDEMNALKSGEEECLKRHNQLLQSIGLLSQHSFLKDDPFRNVHQLDYATSGVLLFGKTKKAAAAACRSFEERKTNKQYVAVVINPFSSPSNATPPFGPGFFEQLSVLPASHLESWGDGSLEKRYRKKRQRDMDEREGKRGTFDGYMPIHSVFDKWRAALLREKKERETMQQNAEQSTEVVDKKRKRKKQYLPDLPSPKIALMQQDIDELLSLGNSWKAVKSNCADTKQNWMDILETMTKEYNQSLAEYYANKSVGNESKDGNGHECEKKKMNAASNLPPLFRVKSDNQESKDKTDSSPDLNTFYICASIGEPKDGRFHVIVDPSAVLSRETQQILDSAPLPELRPSLTRCTVLWRGFMNSKDKDGNDQRIPAAKVLLKPWTGRRHQLRVHMAHVAGCPILGDVAYGGSMNADGDSNERGVLYRRMCLHAKELNIPLIGGTKTFVAPDPFVTKECDGGDETLVIL